MILDSSAIIAVICSEQEAARISSAIKDNLDRRICSANLLECTLVLNSRYGKKGLKELDYFIQRSNVEIVPFNVEMCFIARECHLTYGRGSKHKAKLNFGDCFAYATAKYYSEPLLYVGNDFNHTDIKQVKFR